MELSNIVFNSPIYANKDSAWKEHIPFAFFITEILKPKVLVELGVHNGVSYFSFCQAIKQLQYQTRAFAVDNWQGDVHSGFYDKDVYNYVKKVNSENFAEFSDLLKMDFDEALSNIGNGEIDLLHIDGCHTYDAIKHDFYAWLPKMSKRGVVLFHDTNINMKNFGVQKFFNEIKKNYKHLEFEHGFGLGLLIVGEELEIPTEKIITSLNSDLFARNLFMSLGKRVALECQLDEKEKEIQIINNQNLNHAEHIKELSNEVHRVNLQLEEIVNSVSWKITAPLRTIKKLFGVGR